MTLTQSRTLNKSQTLVMNKAENRRHEMSYATDREYRKSATKLVSTSNEHI